MSQNLKMIRAYHNKKSNDGIGNHCDLCTVANKQEAHFLCVYMFVDCNKLITITCFSSSFVSFLISLSYLMLLELACFLLMHQKRERERESLEVAIINCWPIHATMKRATIVCLFIFS